MTPDRSKAARELLAFYAEAGVDAVDRRSSPTICCPQPEPPPAPTVERAASRRGIDWRQAPPRSRRSAGSAALRRVRRRRPPAPDAAVMAAREAARSAASLEELRAILDRFEGCSLKGSAQAASCSPTARPGSRLMFVGEAPGAEEDKQGLPFVGRSGQLLDRMLDGDRARPHTRSTSPTSCRGGRRATARRRRSRRRSACRSSSARSSSAIPTCWSPSASPRPARCSACRAS